MNLEQIKFTPLLDTLRLENIDDSVYFSEKYSGYISNSRLGLINPEQDGNPKKYFEGFGGNKIYSDALIFGSAVHQLSLQPESFFLADTVNRPTAKAGFIADIISKKTINVDEITDEMLIEAATEVDYYHGNLDEKKLTDLRNKITPYFYDLNQFYQFDDRIGEPIFLDVKNRERLNGCLEGLNSNFKIQKLLHPTGLLDTPISENEQTILLDVQVDIPGKEPFIIKLKSKLDNFTIDKENNTITVNDVKTTGKKVNEFNDAITRFHYNREMAMYCWLLSLCAKKYYGMENPIIKSNFLVVSTIPSYYTKVVPMTRELFMSGFEELKRLTKMVAYYIAYPEQIEAECMTL